MSLARVCQGHGERFRLSQDGALPVFGREFKEHVGHAQVLQIAGKLLGQAAIVRREKGNGQIIADMVQIVDVTQAHCRTPRHRSSRIGSVGNSRRQRHRRGLRTSCTSRLRLQLVARRRRCFGLFPFRHLPISIDPAFIEVDGLGVFDFDAARRDCRCPSE